MNTVSKKNLIIFILYTIFLFPFFGPRGTIIINQNITKILFTYLPIILSSFLFINLIKTHKLSQIIFFIILFFAYIVIITFIKKGDIYNILLTSIKSIGLCLLIDYGIKNNIKLFIKSIYILLLILIFINFLTLILFPKGMYVSDTNYAGNWFLGYRNVHILFMFPTIIFSKINGYLDNRKSNLSNCILTLFCLLSLLLAGSSTSLLGVFCIFIYLIFENKFIVKKINIKSLNYIFIILYISIVILRMQDVFKYLIVNVLNRNLTFTNRIYIWDQVINYIKINPILGYGVEYRNLRLLKTNPISYHAHNQILEIIYQSGFVGFAIFTLITIKSLKKLKVNSGDSLSKFLAFSMFIFFVMTITEAYSYDCFLYLFVLCSNISLIIKEKNLNEKA